MILQHIIWCLQTIKEFVVYDNIYCFVNEKNDLIQIVIFMQILNFIIMTFASSAATIKFASFSQPMRNDKYTSVNVAGAIFGSYTQISLAFSPGIFISFVIFVNILTTDFVINSIFSYIIIKIVLAKLFSIKNHHGIFIKNIFSFYLFCTEYLI